MKIIRKKKVEVQNVVPMDYREMMEFEGLKTVKKGELEVKDLLDMAKTLDDKCYDVDYKVKDLDFWIEKDGILRFESLKSEFGTFSDYSMSQMFMRFGIPNTYANFCRKNGANELLQDNLKHWIDKFGGEYMFRMYKHDNGDDIVRGMLTQKYKAFDTLDIMKVARANIPLNRNFSVRSYLMNPERLHVRLVSDKPLDVENEDLFMGVTIDSSDVGRSSLRMSIIVYKQVCTNGLILPKSVTPIYRQIHFGAGADRFSESIVACLSAVEPAREVAETIITSSSKKVLPFNIESEEEVEKFRVNHKLSKSVMEDTVKLVSEEKYGKPSLWTFINSLTESAQKVSLESRIDTEREAGRLLLTA